MDKLRQRVSNAEEQLKGVQAENQRLRQDKVKSNSASDYWEYQHNNLSRILQPIFSFVIFGSGITTILAQRESCLSQWMKQNGLDGGHG